MVLSEDFIAKATKLPQTDDKWFKKGEINKIKCKQFLLPLPQDLHDKFVFPVKFLKPQWLPLFQIILRYITCNGRFSYVHLYHLRLLMELKGSKLNFPYLLLSSLEKMATAVQNTIEVRDQSLLRLGLIKILVQYQLSLNGKTWDHFF